MMRSKGSTGAARRALATAGLLAATLALAAPAPAANRRHPINEPYPVAGNPVGRRILRVYFDPVCGPCAIAERAVGALLHTQADLRVEQHPMPIALPNRPGAMEGAQAVMAAHRQGAGVQMIEALLENTLLRKNAQRRLMTKDPSTNRLVLPDDSQLPGFRITREAIGGLVTEMHLDTARFWTDYGSSDAMELIRRSAREGKKLRQGTPAFVLDETPIPTVDLPDQAGWPSALQSFLEQQLR